MTNDELRMAFKHWQPQLILPVYKNSSHGLQYFAALIKVLAGSTAKRTRLNVLAQYAFAGQWLFLALLAGDQPVAPTLSNYFTSFLPGNKVLLILRTGNREGCPNGNRLNTLRNVTLRVTSFY